MSFIIIVIYCHLLLFIVIYTLVLYVLALLACIVLHNICIEKRNSTSHKLDLPYDKNGNTRKSPKELRIVKMVSSICYLDTSKGAIIQRNNICDYLWNKSELYNDL